MSQSSRSPFPYIIGAVLVLGIGGGAAFALWPEPEPEPEPEDAADNDTGMNRQQVEDMMRTIGYVQ